MYINEKLNSLGYYKIESYKNLYYNNINEVSYSDGDIEDVIFEVLNHLPSDKFQREKILEEAIFNWPTKYHFAWERVNILKPIIFNSNDYVLELGGGTGILSEYISNKVHKIVTIEGTLKRAKSISARCKDRDNIDVIVANFLNLDLINLFGENSFDKITLIGVLEYVPKFSNDPYSIDKLLETCNKLIKKDGELIIAIENKLGLKYLLGYDEDHHAKQYYGIQSLYKKDEATTFTKAVLNSKLKSVNFSSIGYYFPFPDYKLPNVIIKDCDSLYTEKGAGLITTLLYNTKSSNYSGKGLNRVHEGRVLENFISSKSLDLISNSFLIVATKTSKRKEYEPFAMYFSTNRRYPYASEIKFFDNQNSIEIIKEWYGKKTNSSVLNLVSEGKLDIGFVDGNNVDHVLHNFYVLNEKEKFIGLFKDWLSFLSSRIDEFENYAFDMLPFNTLVDNDGNFYFIDIKEWQTSQPLSISQTVTRYVIGNKEIFEWLLSIKKDKMNEFINEVLKKFNLPLLNSSETDYLKDLNVFLETSVHRKSHIIKNLGVNNKKKITLIRKIVPQRIVKLIKNKL